MTDVRLNLEMLRAGGRRAGSRTGVWPRGLQGSPSPPGCSRRDFIMLGGVALPAAIPIVERLPTPFEMRGDERRLAFVVDGQEAWVIDPGRFSGSPRLSVERRRDEIRVRLENARFPGTSIPADLCCELRRGPLNWRMRLELALPGFRSEVSFVRWLLLAAPATSSVRLDLTACEVGSGALALRTLAPATASFLPNWVLQLDGPRVAILTGPEGSLVADAIQVALPDSALPSLMSPAPPRRALLELERGDHPWQVLPSALLHGRPWQLAAAAGAFDRLTIETGEDGTGRRRGAVAACSAAGAAAAVFHPAAGLAGRGGEVPGLALCNLRYVASFGDGPPETAILGDFHGDGAWLASGGLNLKLGPAAAARGFELLSTAGGETAVRAAPAVLAVAAELPGGVLSSFHLAAARHVELWWGEGDATDHANVLHVERDGARISLQLEEAALTVTRPRDLLHLTFRFENLHLESRWGNLYLARTPASRANPQAHPALIVVEFPPQSIQERAFFATAPNNIKVAVPKDYPPGELCKLEPDLQSPVPPASCPCPPTADALIDPPVASRISGGSRLVFEVPAKTKHLPLTLASLLNWSEYAPRIAPRARTDASSQNAGPVTSVPDDQTMIEMPYRLMISPNEKAGWAHPVRPRDLGTRHTELWHTHLGILDREHRRVDENAATERSIRALWSPDFVPLEGKPPDHCFTPFRAALDARDRDEIVHLTANFEIKTKPQGTFTPLPVAVDDLRMSALGAWLKSRGSWAPPVLDQHYPQPDSLCALTVEEWKHQATMARDHYVRVVYKGYLLPFGHHASLVKVTERRFEDAPSGGVAAYLRQRMFIVIREPTKTYAAVGQPYAGRQLPCVRITMTTIVTPDLQDPTESLAVVGAPSLSAFWPRVVKGEDFRFHYLLEDADGRKAEATVPLIFVDSNVAHENPFNAATLLRQVVDKYNAVEDRQRRVSDDFGGKKLAFAASKKPGDTEFETLSLTYYAAIPDIPKDQLPDNKPKQDLCAPETLNYLLQTDQPPFYPAVAQAEIRVASVQAMSGQAKKSVKVRYDQTYLAAGFDLARNRGEVFLALDSDLDLGFGGGATNADRSGGVVTPSANIVGLSRRLGPVGGGKRAAADPPDPPGAPAQGGAQDLLAKVRGGTFDPLDFFGGALEEAKILGGIKLWDIIKPIAQGALDNLGDAPAMLTQLVYEGKGVIDQANSQLLQLLDELQQQVPAAIRTTFQARFGPLISQIQDNVRLVQKGSLDREPEVVQGVVRLVDGMANLVRNPGVLAQDAIDAVTGSLGQQLSTVLAAVGGFLDQLAALQQQVISAQDQVPGALAALQAEALKQADLAKQQVDDEVAAALRAQLLADAELFSHLEQDLRRQFDTVRGVIEAAQLAKTAVQNQDWQAVVQIVAADQGLLAPLSELAVQLARLGDADKLRKGGLALQQQVADLKNALLEFFKPPLQPVSADWTSLETELEPFINVLNSQNAGEAKALTALRDAVRRDFTNLAAYDPTAPAQVRSFLRRQQTLLADFAQLHGLLDRNGIQHDGLAGKIVAWGNQLTALDPAPAKQDILKGMVGLLSLPGAGPDGLFARASQAASELRQGIQALSNLQLGPWLDQASKVLGVAERVREPVEVAILVIYFGAPNIEAPNLSSQLRQAASQAALLAKTLIDFLHAAGGKLKDLQGILDALSQLPELARAVIVTQLGNLRTHLGKLMTKLQDLQAAAVDELVDLELQVLGDLKQVLDRLLHAISSPLEQVAELLRTADSLRNLLAGLVPTSLTLSYDWRPRIKSFPADQPVFEVDGSSSLTVSASFTMPLDPSVPPSYSVQGEMKSFKVNLIAQPQFITVDFGSLSFTTRSGAKADCQVKINGVRLADELSFISALEKFLSPQTGPFLELSQDGILTGFRFGVPSLTFGAFNLNDLRLGVAVNLPFSGDPMRLRLMVSDRGHPFLLSSGIFGGGGFFGLALGLDGVEMVEGALEFGVTGELDIGVAHGSGFILAGIYFRTEGSRSRVCGFVRAGGEMDILGLVSMSIDVHVDLCYDASTGTVKGDAVYVVHVHLVFFDQSVDLHASYTFAGSSQDTSASLEQPAAGAIRLAAAAPLAGAGLPASVAADTDLSFADLAAQAAQPAAAAASRPRPPAAGTCPQPAFRNLADPAQYRQYRRKFARKGA